MFRQEATSAFSWFSCGSHILVQMQFEDVFFFCKARKTVEPRGKPSEKGEYQQK